MILISDTECRTSGNPNGQPVNVLLSTSNITLDLSNFKNVNLFIAGPKYDTPDRKELSIDLDHPYLPREYNRLRLDSCRLVGNFKNKITVHEQLIIYDDVEIENNKFIHYFNYVKCFNNKEMNLYWTPLSTRYLDIQFPITVDDLWIYFNRLPKLRSVPVTVYGPDDDVNLFSFISQNIHLLDKSILDRLDIGYYMDESQMISGLKQWFTNYTLVLCFYKASKQYPGLFLPLVTMVKNGYIKENTKRRTLTSYLDCPDYK